jgi:tetratricopeptide (TPR) repeat protein
LQEPYIENPYYIAEDYGVEYLDVEAFVYRGYLEAKKSERKQKLLPFLDYHFEVFSWYFTFYDEIKNTYKYFEPIDKYIDSSNFDVIVFQCYQENDFTLLEFTLSKINSHIRIIDIRDLNYEKYLSERHFISSYEKFEIFEDSGIYLDSIFYEINILMNEGRFQDAESSFKSIPNEFSSHEVIKEMELSMIKKIDYELYLEKIEKINSSNHYEPSKLMQKLKIAKSQKKFEEVIFCLDELISLYPKSSIFYFEKAKGFEGLKKKQETINCYQKAIELSPNIWEFKEHLFYFYLQQNMFPEGLALVEVLIFSNNLFLSEVDEYIMKDFTEFHQSKEYQDWKMSVEETSSGSL